jgi:hypothetical protein
LWHSLLKRRSHSSVEQGLENERLSPMSPTAILRQLSSEKRDLQSVMAVGRQSLPDWIRLRQLRVPQSIRLISSAALRSGKFRFLLHRHSAGRMVLCRRRPNPPLPLCRLPERKRSNHGAGRRFSPAQGMTVALHC